MKIRYIEPRARGATLYEFANLPKLGLPLLAACLRERHPDVDQRIYCELIRGVEVDWDDLADADLVCISTTTNTSEEGYAHADRARAMGIPVLMGGAHVTFMAEEAMSHADYVIRREGHVGFLQLVDWMRRGGASEELREVAGLSWRDADGRRADNPEAEPATSEDLEAMPFPALDLLVGRERLLTYPLMVKWGCPYSCNFCSVIRMFGRRLRSRSVESVMRELREVRPERVFFYDDIFIVDRKRTKELLRAMIAEGITPHWTAQIRADSLYRSKRDLDPDLELLDLMRRSGCFMVYVGFESVTQAGLDAFNKRQRVEHITTSIGLLRQHGIRVHGMFVVGADPDTPATVRETVDFAIRHRLDTIQMMMLTVLPGTAFDQDMRRDGRVLTDDYRLYDGHHCVIAPGGMSAYDLQVSTFRAMRRFYSLRRTGGLLVRQVVRNAGVLAGLVARERRLLRTLPRVAWLAGTRRGSAAFALLRRSLTPRGLRAIYDVFGVVAFRGYGRGQLLKFARQPTSRRYVGRLRAAARESSAAPS